MYRFFIRGVVQGVGFRPWVYNSCTAAGLKGYVQNTGDGVVVVVDDKDKFVDILGDRPPLSRIDSWEATDHESEPGDYEGFSIVESSGKGFAEVPPDLFLCEDCLRELREKGNRREGYFFITCTNCGPRFSIAKTSPYDRDTTSMGEFEMCDRCAAEYKNPTDRRYHAQTIACHECGPKIRLLRNGKTAGGIKEAAQLIKDGEVVAIKGVGGFHLACRVDSVRGLRKLTMREHKPYAVMALDVDSVRKFAEAGAREKELLESVERPIVLLKKMERSELNGLERVSELDTVGVMLPYTALHYLLLEEMGQPIVMTSSNMPDYPITTRDDEQFVVDVLDHDREIVNQVDDSVVKVVGDKTLMLRRSRGYVPRSIPVDIDVDLIALGAEMNNTFCVVKDGKAYMSQYMGTTSNYDTYEKYKDSIYRMLKMVGCEPKVVLCDKHPEYNTTHFAAELAGEFGAKVVKVQHHVAHAYSVAAEHGLKDFVAIVADGMGYGDDGTVWGGEVFDISAEAEDGYRRIGHLEEQYQLGGDSAAQNPNKMLMGILYGLMTREGLMKRMLPHFDGEHVKILLHQLEEGYNCPKTTSCGRILDAVAAFLELCDKRTYDGRPAMLLEANSSDVSKAYEIEPAVKDGILYTMPLFRWLLLNDDKDRSRLAATVQLYIAKGLYQLAREIGEGKTIVFSGGCAYNKIMTDYLLSKGVLVNEKVPCGDGGISFGQVAYHSAMKKS